MGVRPYARGYADWLYGNKDPEGSTGIYRDTQQGEAGFDFGKGLGQLDLYGLLNQSTRAGSMGRDLGAQTTMGGLGYANNLMGGAGDFMSRIPDVLSASNHFLQKGNDALSGFSGFMGSAGGDLDSARRILGNVMQPTAYNPMFQNALNNQVLPGINAGLAARGLGGSGYGLQAEATNNLANDFAMRQFQEQNQAQQGVTQASQNYGGLLQGYGNLSGNLAQMPANIYSQLGSMYPGMAGLAGLPQSIVGTGMDLYRTGSSMPLETMQDIYNITRGPQLAGGQLISSTN